MPDYGHELLFGCFIAPVAEQSETVVTLARLADASGLDLVTVQDHPYQPAFLDTWTLLSDLAARTQRVGSRRTSPTCRCARPRCWPGPPPASTSSASGRVELGLGAGASGTASRPWAVRAAAPARRSTALEEAIAVIRALWTRTAPAQRIEGKHYRLAGAKPGPFPVHPIGIWLGAYGPRMLALTGRVADGWLPSQGYAGPERLAEMNQRIDEAAVGAGRDPAAMRRLYNLNGSFGAGGDSSRARRTTGSSSWPGWRWSRASAASCSASTRARRARLQRFAEEVAPGVVLAVAHERGSRATDAGPGGRPGAAARAAPTRPGGRRQHRDHRPRRHAHARRRPPAERRAGLGRVDAARPRPATEPDAAYTEAGRRDGQALVEVHDHLRAELAPLRDLVEQVAAGDRRSGRRGR